MAHKVNTVVGFASLIVIGLLGSAAVITAAEPASAVLTMGVPGPADGQAARMAEALAEEVAKATRDRVTITVEAVPGIESLTLETVLRGDYDLGWIESRDLAASIPSLEILGWPFFFDGELQADSFFNGAGGQRVARLVEDRGVIIACWIRSYPLQLISRQDVSTPEAFRDRRIAVPRVEAMSRFARALGATAVPLKPDERPAAAEDGRIDVAEANFYTWAADGYPEDMAFAVMSSHYVPMVALCHTNAALAKIPPESRASFARGLARGADTARFLASQLNNDAILELEEAGKTIISVDMEAFREATAAEYTRILSGADPEIVSTAETANVPPVIY